MASKTKVEKSNLPAIKQEPTTSKSNGLIGKLQTFFPLDALPFVHQKHSLLGVDITSQTVKVLGLSQDSHGYTVTHYSKEALPLGAISDREIKQPEAVSAAIKQAIAQANYSGGNVAIAMPSVNVITKIIQVNASLSDYELETLLRVEAEKYIPHPMEEVQLDFHVLGPVEKNPDQVNVVLIAALLNNIDERVNLVKAAGFNVKVVDVEAYAIERATSVALAHLPVESLRGIVAVFDIGANMMAVNVMVDNQLIYTREESFGGSQLTAALQEQLNINYHEAEKIKLSTDTSKGELAEAIAAFQRSIGIQLQRSLQLFFSATQYSKVDLIVLAGGVAAMPGLAEALQTKLEETVILANPLQNMAFAPHLNAELIKHEAGSLMAVTGLALRAFD